MHAETKAESYIGQTDVFSKTELWRYGEETELTLHLPTGRCKVRVVRMSAQVHIRKRRVAPLLVGGKDPVLTEMSVLQEGQPTSDLHRSRMMDRG